MKLTHALLALTFVAGAALAAEGKRPITHDDYDSWKQIQGPQISRDGKWVVYREVPGEGDGEIVAKASGIPSNRRQIPATAEAMPGVSRKPGLTAAARSTKRRIDSTAASRTGSGVSSSDSCPTLSRMMS